MEGQTNKAIGKCKGDLTIFEGVWMREDFDWEGASRVSSAEDCFYRTCLERPAKIVEAKIGK